MSIASSGSLYSMELLAKRLSTHIDLSQAERDLLLARSHSARCYSSGSTVVMPEHPSLRPTLIVSGWACRERITASGNRQLLSVLMPGDLIWDGGEDRPLDLLEVVAVSNLTVINIASAVRTMEGDPSRFGSLRQGLAMLRLVEEEQLLEHVVRLGSQSALQRMASLILELFERCHRIGFVTGRTFVMPLTQECLGNFVGLSIIHVNRILRRLKLEGLIRLRSGLIEILDRSGLADIADASVAEQIRLSAVDGQHTPIAAREMAMA